MLADRFSDFLAELLSDLLADREAFLAFLTFFIFFFFLDRLDVDLRNRRIGAEAGPRHAAVARRHADHRVAEQEGLLSVRGVGRGREDPAERERAQGGNR